MNTRHIKGSLALVVGLMALPISSKEVVTIFNNMIFPANVELTFDCSGNKCKQTRSMPARTSAQFDFPRYSNTMAGGQKSSGNESLTTIKATVPAQQEIIWANGKVGSTPAGMKTVRAEKSVVFTTGSGKGRVNQESATFVINANSNSNNRLILNDVEQVQNLAIYRFIQ